jgi:hypothetical protein
LTPETGLTTGGLKLFSSPQVNSPEILIRAAVFWQFISPFSPEHMEGRQKMVNLQAGAGRPSGAPGPQKNNPF